jgi:hypothetical protein
MVLIDVGDVARVNGAKKLDEPVSFVMPILGPHVASMPSIQGAGSSTKPKLRHRGRALVPVGVVKLRYDLI